LGSLKDSLFANWSSPHMKVVHSRTLRLFTHLHQVVISLSQTFQFLAALAIFGALTAYGRGEPSKTRSSRSILFPHRMHGEPKTKLRDDIVAHFISHGFLGAGFQFAGLLAVRGSTLKC
jgi:hypothetical protein